MAKVDAISGTLPPQNLEAETAVLGTVLMSSDALSKLESTLKPEHFYKRGHGIIYEAAISLNERKQQVDLISITEELRKQSVLEEVGGISYLHALMDGVAGSSNVEYYAELVRDRATLRSIITASQRMMSQCYEPDVEVDRVLDKAQQEIFGLTQNMRLGKVYSLKDLMVEAYEIVDRAAAKKGGISGLSTGLLDLDEKTSGFQPGEFIIVAGRPSTGKSSLAVTIAMNVAMDQRKPVLIFSLEMPREMVVLRMLCAQARVPMRKVRAGKLSDQDYEKLSMVAGALSSVPIYLDDTPGLSMMDMRAKSRQLKLREPDLAMIVVDYLQLMEVRRRMDNRQLEVAEISRGLKGLAREIRVPLVGVSQLSRAAEQRVGDSRPQLFDLRDSGAIEQDGDLIIFIYRDKKSIESADEGIAELIIGKNRNGPTGSFRVSFLKEHMLFKDYFGEDQTGQLPDSNF